MKEQIIQLPDNLEVKEIKDGKIILVEKEKKLTYEDVARKLFGNREYIHYIGEYGDIFKTKGKRIYDLNNCTSSKQAQKLIAINKLMNVAKNLNGDWQPDWLNENMAKYFIYLNTKEDINIDFWVSIHYSSICFKTKELAQQAIEILGEETIKLALCTDY